MQKMLYKTLVLLLVIQHTRGHGIDWSFLPSWLREKLPFAREHPVQPALAEVSDECIRYAETGDCRFYQCFEERHPCGHGAYIQKYGWGYCHGFVREINRFNTRGKRWVNETKKCSMRALLTKYRASQYDCHAIKHHAEDTHRDCAINKGFCAILWPNREALMDIYKLGSKKHLLRTIAVCGRDAITRFLGQIGSSLMFGTPFSGKK
ncbi:unnamed protein product [Owenia fusiformis]|uniref:Uncharacterized protein n=1 Tax=Owenia fusiformis TaxID=6347 RepID=A0A8S4PQX7_OWEFU|nr:unnamed protein product [Owenia fusiformis]